MNKNVFGIIVGVAAIITAVWLWPEEKEVAPVATPTTDISTSTEPTFDIELDLSKLQGKDRLYTEEEGKYENLSEEERRMVDSMICGDGYQFDWLCGELPESPYTDDIRLVALKNGIAAVTMPNDASAGRLYIYDVAQAEITERYNNAWNLTFGPDYIVKSDSLIEKDKVRSWSLQFYKPGMADFAMIRQPEIALDEIGTSGMNGDTVWTRTFPVSIDGDVITVFLQTFKNCVDTGSAFAPGTFKCEIASETPMTFDLLNLP